MCLSEGYCSIFLRKISSDVVLAGYGFLRDKDLAFIEVLKNVIDLP
jgi:hypothetical protein